MATKELHVCDFCNKILIGNARTVEIDGTKFTDVCENCCGRLNTFVKKLGTPYVPKNKKEAEAVLIAEPVQEPAPAQEPPKAGFGRKK